MNFRKIFENSPDPEDFKKERKKENTPFDEFQKEIEEFKEQEKKNGKAVLTSINKVPEVKTSELTEEDMKIWEKFKNDELELEELEEYRNNIDPDNYDRKAFSNFVIRQILDNNDKVNEA